MDSKSFKPLKPYKLRRWQLREPLGAGHFYTCARPGRTGDSKSKHGNVSDAVVHRWVSGLPDPSAVIISLLGMKRDGLSEYSFYSFFGGSDQPSDDGHRPSFRSWLQQSHPGVVLIEYPTIDMEPIPTETLNHIATRRSREAAANSTRGWTRRATGMPAISSHSLSMSQWSETISPW